MRIVSKQGRVDLGPTSTQVEDQSNTVHVGYMFSVRVHSYEGSSIRLVEETTVKIFWSRIPIHPVKIFMLNLAC